MSENMVVFTFWKHKICAVWVCSVSEHILFSAFFLHQLTRVFLSALLQQCLAELTEVVLDCDAAQQANLRKPLRQAMVSWDSRLSYFNFLITGRATYKRAVCCVKWQHWEL